MSVYILVKAVGGWNPDDPMIFQEGYIINARPFKRLGGKQVPPNFIQIELTDADDHAAIDAVYARPWKRFIDWEFVGHDYSIDGHRLNVFVKQEYVSVSGLAGLTREMVENYLNNWGASIYSIAANSVVFDVTVFGAISSTSFWGGRNISGIEFTENDYDSTTGIHTVEADYSGVAIEPNTVELLVMKNGGTIVKHPTSKITFTIQRSTVFEIFKQSVKEAIDGTPYSQRQFKIPTQYVQAALDNEGTLSVTWAQFAAYVRNRLDD
jgi:hypothetical protein